MEVKDLRQKVEAELGRSIPDEQWEPELIWYYCLADADSICDDDTLRQCAEMLRDGIEPKTIADIESWLRDLEEDDATLEAIDVASHFRRIKT